MSKAKGNLESTITQLCVALDLETSQDADLRRSIVTYIEARGIPYVHAERVLEKFVHAYMVRRRMERGREKEE